jgi:DNA-binding Lrp family transcriptional regulator
MDAIDAEILSLVQSDGRATMTDVARKVGLSLSACHRRFRELQASGVIRGFSVDLDLEKLGLPFEALVFVTMRSGDGAAVLGVVAALLCLRLDRAVEDAPAPRP